MRAGKDHPRIIEFRRLYRKFRDWADDDPSALKAKVSDDEGLRKLCIDLHFAQFRIQTDERGHRKLFRDPVDAKFIADWRDYEDRWDAILSDIAWDEICAGVDLPSVPNAEAKDPFVLLWEAADEGAREETLELDAAIEHAVSSVEFGDFPDGYPESVERAVREFRRLPRKIGLDLNGVLRRRQLIPLVLIPEHVAARHGRKLGPAPDAKISLFLQLQQAQEAFVFALPLAALSQMRALLELVLTYHYEFSAEKKLFCKINELEEGTTKQALLSLWSLANDVLHSGKRPKKKSSERVLSEIERARRLKEERELEERKIMRFNALVDYTASLASGSEPLRMDVMVQMERELVFYLRALRDLIEAAPMK